MSRHLIVPPKADPNRTPAQPASAEEAKAVGIPTGPAAGGADMTGDLAMEHSEAAAPPYLAQLEPVELLAKPFTTEQLAHAVHRGVQPAGAA